MKDFDTIYHTLRRHLPHAAAGTGVEITPDRVSVAAPGISIGDLPAFLADLTGEDGFLPPDLPVDNIRLYTLELVRRSGRWGADFEFTLRWDRDSAELSIADTFPVRMTEAELQCIRYGERLLAHADVVLTIDGYHLNLALELPSQLVRGRLDNLEDPGAAALLQGRNIAPGNTVKLRDLSVEASIPFAHVQLHVDLEDLFSAGPVSMRRAEAMIALSESAADMQAEVATLLEIAVKRHDPVHVAAFGEVDAHGWRVAGEIDSDSLTFKAGDLVASVASDLGASAPVLPATIRDLELSRLAIELDTHDDSFVIDCTLDWDHSDAELTLHAAKTGTHFEVSGTLELGSLLFRVAFDKGADAVLLADFEAAGERGLTIEQAVGAFSGSTGISNRVKHSDVVLGIKSMTLALDKGGVPLMAARVGAGVDLSRLGDLPLVGSLLPKAQDFGIDVNAVYLGKGFTALDQARQMLPEGIVVNKNLRPGAASFTASMRLGGEITILDTGRALNDAGQAAPPVVESGGKPLAQSDQATPLSWTSAEVSLGPVKLTRVGYAMPSASASAIDLAFDGSLAVAGLTLGLDGLGAHYDFSSRALKPRLQGLSLDLKRGPLEIGGGFLNNDGDFAGRLVIGTEKFGLHALASFMMLDGAPSMFAFGVLDMPLGGPVFLFVEGLAAGFGVHRQIHMPRIEDVHQFPLVSSAVTPPSHDEVNPEAEMRALHEYMSPRLGEYFFAAGLKFNSFRLLHGYAVAVVSLGRDFELDLIGTASFATPPDLPASVPALAHVDLDIMARFDPNEGFLGIEARLNPKSYVYGPLCHLSGGFALYAWFVGERSGDFVLSIGGYHPVFDRPRDYPVVPRVELKYQVSSEFYLKGDAYFALTPSCLMAGGGLHAQARTGSLHAWADLTVDFIVAWEPFHYDALMHIGIGAQWKCFYTSASADLHIWGPKFSGYAEVDWAVFSFEVEFGPGTPNFPLPISRAKFKQSFLGIDEAAPPAQRKSQTDAMLGIVVADGVIGSVAGRNIVTAHNLKFSLSSRVPVNAARLGDIDIEFEAEVDIGMAPSGGKSIGSSAIEIKIEHAGGSTPAALFVARPVITLVPAALWGRKYHVDKNDRPIKALTGVEIVPADPPTPGASDSRSAHEMWEQFPVLKARRRVSIPRPSALAFDLILRTVGSSRIAVIKVIRDELGIGLRRAKSLTDHPDTLLVTKIDATRARSLVEIFAAEGAFVEALPSANGGVAIASRLPLDDLAALGLETKGLGINPAASNLPIELAAPK